MGRIGKYVYIDGQNSTTAARMRTLAPDHEEPIAMIFRNLNIYSMPEVPDIETLESYFESHKFRPCMPSHRSSSGFTRILGKDSRILSINGIHLFCMLTEEKNLPASAVKTRLNRLVAEEERRQGRKVTRNEKAEMKEKVVDEMIRQAFTRTLETWAYIDSRSKILVIDSSSQKLADGIARVIKGALEGGIIYPLRPRVDVSEVMAGWLKKDSAPSPLELGDKCEIHDEKGTIKYRKRSLEDDNLKEYLNEDLRVKVLSLETDRCRFVLTDEFLIKEFALKDLALMDLDYKGDDQWLLMEARLQLMVKEVRVLLSHLVKSIVPHSK